MTKINDANINMMEQNLAVTEICYADLLKNKNDPKVEKSKNDLKRHAISIEVIDKGDIDSNKTIRLELRNPDNECIVKKYKINENTVDLDKDLIENSDLSKLIKYNDSLIIGNGNCDTNSIENLEYLNGDGDKVSR